MAAHNIHSDLTDRQFGRLHVLQYLGQRKYECLCACGTTITVRGDHLSRSETLSCGCLYTPREDLTGKTFGEWTVLEFVTNHQSGMPLWRCRCSCGTEKIQQSSNLRSSSTTNCGCRRTYDYVGRIFGRLRVLLVVVANPTMLVCVCECGNQCRVYAGNVVAGYTQSCGCLARETARASATKFHATHGYSHSRAYSCWQSMKQRCYNPHAANYAIYGGQGIRISDDHWHQFVGFLADMGHPPTPRHSLDRYPDPAGHYCKTNCRWATPQEQSRNRTVNRYVTYQGATLCVAEWAEILRIPAQRIHSRLRLGWPIERVFTTPSLRGVKSRA